eukprot:COSAG06_NODE_4893_length_3877_cov_5.358391_2_plen_530_part_00
MGICSACEAGQAASSGQSRCFNCAPGQEPDAGQARCVTCPDGLISQGMLPTGSDRVCQPCAAGKQSDSDRLACVDCQSIGSAYFSLNGATCERCDDAFGISQATPAGTRPNEDRTGCTDCPAGTIGIDGQCRSPCSVLSCTNSTMTPDNPGETTATLDGMGVLCPGAGDWVAEQAGRSVSAVIAGVYDPSENLHDAVPRVYDDAIPNAVQCSAGGGECPMRVGEGASNTAADERTAIMVVAEDSSVGENLDRMWRMTCYVEVEVRIANLELTWAGMPERLQMDSLATKSELSSFRIMNPGQPGIDDPLVVAQIAMSYEDTVGAPACPRADAECSSVSGWLAVTGTRDFSGTPVVLPALVQPGSEMIVTLRSSGIAAGFRDAEFWGRVSVITSGEVVAGELPVKMQVAEEALRIIALPSVLPSATLAAGSSGTAAVTFYNVDQRPLVWEILESEYSGPTAWVTQQPPAADDPTQAAPVRCHETASPAVNGYDQSTTSVPPVSLTNQQNLRGPVVPIDRRRLQRLVCRLLH